MTFQKLSIDLVTHVTNQSPLIEIHLEGIERTYEDALRYELDELRDNGGSEAVSYPLLEKFMQFIDVLSNTQTSLQLVNIHPDLHPTFKRIIHSNENNILAELIIRTGNLEPIIWKPRNIRQTTPVSPAAPRLQPVNSPQSERLALSTLDLSALSDLDAITRHYSFSDMGRGTSPLDVSFQELDSSLQELEHAAPAVAVRTLPQGEPEITRQVSFSIASTNRSTIISPNSLTLELNRSNSSPLPASDQVTASVAELELIDFKRKFDEIKKALTAPGGNLTKLQLKKQHMLAKNLFSQMYACSKVFGPSHLVTYEELEKAYNEKENLLQQVEGYIKGIQNYITALENQYLAASCPQSFFYRVKPVAAPVADLTAELTSFSL
jgi:hypothetical protein